MTNQTSLNRTSEDRSKKLPKNHEMKRSATQAVNRLLNKQTPDKQLINQMQSEIKMLEFSGIKTLQDCLVGLSLVLNRGLAHLNSSDLTNKQKTEIRLVAQIEACKIITALVDDVQQLKQQN